ncbi:MAG: DNA/RNA non-specific endonuclease [Brevundimonas sp.]|uniref:DNA/RNA non-specific endonuclease n=1 Tax=Brevundimonas sp. TaxID=1871086 RepID=UPI0024881D88|nr:DNA/RNA non-specific endonuclease [Brevundimonas sp.]MDI1327979.1 DNA/RNA non-specific endonuclease [Brevundimonas sp.]
MRVDRLKGVVETTGARIVHEVAPPASGRAAPMEARTAEAVDLLKARVDATVPGQLETPERQALRTLQLQEGGRKASLSELERTIGSDDLVDLNYLLRGLDAARPVGRITILDGGGRALGDATGFLITPNLLLTNQHVFPDAATAAGSRVDFDCELDRLGFPRPTTTFAFDPGRFFVVDPALDMALVAVRAQPLRGDGRLSDFGWLRLSPEVGKINVGEAITIIQHPNGRTKQVAMRENRLLDITADHLTYESDTAPGSSGAPVFNDSWQVVALHHSGVPRKDAQGRWLLQNGKPATDDDDDADIDWIANEGVRASRIATTALALAPAGALRGELEACCLGRAESPVPATERSMAPMPGGAPISPSAAGPGGSTVLTVPLTITVSLGQTTGSAIAASAGAGAGAVEKVVEPWHDPDYPSRTGYDPRFLGVSVPLPTLRDASAAARMHDGGVVVPYQNFSLVMHRARRLCLFTASNVDGSPTAKEPDPTQSYNRDALGGLGENDFERWFLDPRLPADAQLPDRFFDKDRKAFDKGHLVRREEVCWGADYAQVRRANGDTYHVTNCTPQVAGFNRSNRRGVWGLLENLIEAQGRVERYSLFAGPLLAADDPVFVGVDDDGQTQVKVPRAYWKVVIARGQTGLEAFGFLLEQDLTQVAFEFDVDPVWRARMVPLKALQDRIGLIRFPRAVMRADKGV